METLEILSDIRLPPHFCVICKSQINSNIDLRQHYEEHWGNFATDNYDPVEENLLVNESIGDVQSADALLPKEGSKKKTNRKSTRIPKEKPHLVCMGV